MKFQVLVALQNETLMVWKDKKNYFTEDELMEVIKDQFKVSKDIDLIVKLI